MSTHTSGRNQGTLPFGFIIITCIIHVPFPPPPHTHTHSELTKAGNIESQQRIQDAASDRESALEQAQEMADKLERAEKERGELQEALVSAQNQVDDLQYQLDELSKRWVECRVVGAVGRV